MKSINQSIIASRSEANFIILVALLFSTLSLNAQVVQINQTFSSDTIFKPFTGSTPVYSLTMSGKVNLLSDSSLVRVVLIDTYGNHFMVFESYPLITKNNAFDTIGASDETTFLEGVICDSLRIDVINASLDLDSLNLDANFISNATELQAQAKWDHDSVKIVIMNQRIVEEHMYWRAGRNPLVQRSYYEKVPLFGMKYNLSGYDYYKGGIYKRVGEPAHNPSTSLLVDNFDWRNRHKSNETESPYYNHASPPDPEDVLGWITPFQCHQQGNDCYAFAAIYYAEAFTNLYFNNNTGPDPDPNSPHQINLDLSQEQIIVCQNQATNCDTPGNYTEYTYMCNNNIVDEICFPYQCTEPLPNCTIMCTDPEDGVSFGGNAFLTSMDEDYLKSILIEHGPVSCNISLPNTNMTHQMLLVGFSLPQIGDTVYVGEGPNDPPIILDESYTDDEITKWWFKDSSINDFRSLEGILNPYSTNHLNPQYSRYLAGPINRPSFPDTEILCSDEDKDGYYWWGVNWIYENTQFRKLNPQECNCPPGVDADEEDCNDWDKYSGPYDEAYNCIPNCEYSGTPAVFSSDAHWWTDRHFNHDIIIRGCTITIHGVTVWMGPNTKIIIEQDGKLILNSETFQGVTYHPTIKAGCGVLWDGIEVWGTSNEVQAGNQGILDLDKAIIKDMRWGIRNFRPDWNIESGLGPIPGYTGGIILANNSIFSDNKKSVVFGPYTADESASLFNDCTFETNGLLLDGTYANYFVVINSTHGVEFNSCVFQENSSMNSRKAYGIYAYNSDFVFNGGNSDPNNPQFDNFSSLNYGIYAYGNMYNPDFQINVSDSWFNNNRRSIYMSGITGERIRGNVFWIPKITSDTCYGIYLDHSPYWNMITENIFRSINPAGPRGHVGIYVNYCGGEPKEVYKNTFDRLEYGTVAFGVNRSSEGLGLVYRCNGFSNCFNDIVVLDEPEYPDGGIFESCMGIAYYQGDMNDVAGNTFTLPSVSDYNIFNGAVNNIRYRLPSDWESHPEYHPTDINNPVKVFRETGDQSVSEINCDTLPLDYGRDGLDDMLQGLNEEIDSLNVELELLVDGGNTQSLNTTVVSSIPPQALQVYDELMVKSPNLSDSVMNSSILKETVLNNALLRDILVANPQSAKRDSLMEKLDERMVPMPDIMKAEIMEGIHFLSDKEILEADILAKRSKEREIFNRLVSSFCQDTLIADPLDSLKVLFDNDEFLSSKYRLAFSFLKSGEIDAIDTVLNEISSSFSLSSADQAIYQHYLMLFNVLKQLDSVHIYPWYLNSTQALILEELAQDDTVLPGVLARNILVATGLLDYMEKLVFLPDSLKSAIAIESNGNKPHTGNEETGWIKVFPNPANDYIVIEHMLCETDYSADGKIEIFNIQGESLEKIPITKLYDQIIKRCEHYPPGIYVCVLKTGNKKITTSSFIIAQ